MDDLYGDLLPVKQDEKASGWETSARLIQPKIVKREEPKVAVEKVVKKTISKKPTSMVPTALSKKMVPFSVTKRIVPVQKKQYIRSESSVEEELISTAGIRFENEYDPFDPNDYNDYCLERENAKKERKLRQDLSIRQRLLDTEREKEIQSIQQDISAGKVDNVATKLQNPERGVNNMPAWMSKQ